MPSGRPVKRISPDVGFSKPAMQRASVLLPEPEGPTTPSVAACSNVKVVPCSTALPCDSRHRLGYVLDRLRTVSRALADIPQYLPGSAAIHDAAGAHTQYFIGGDREDARRMADQQEGCVQPVAQFAKQPGEFDDAR